MAQLCYYAIANALLTTLFAGLVWCIVKWIRRPALVHLLWVLVLVRLVMPPMLVFSISGVGGWIASRLPAQKTAAILVNNARQQARMLAVVRQAAGRSSIIPVRTLTPRVDKTEHFVPASSALTLGQSVVKAMHGCSIYLLLHCGRAAALALASWLGGSAVCFAFQVYSTLRFRARIRRTAYRSRIWQARTEKVAHRMGLRSCPEVWLVRATCSPMLWGFGTRTRVLFPEKLLESLDSRSQDTLLAHELAHYRRGDQWVRLLELVATILFWWHPVVWWVRREIEAAEEECCDAWAVTQGNPRIYAEALLTTVDFVSLTEWSMPLVASGASRSHLLRNRLQAIMDERSGERLVTPGGYAGAFLLALVVLPPCPILHAIHTTVAPSALTGGVIGLNANQASIARPRGGAPIVDPTNPGRQRFPAPPPESRIASSADGTHRLVLGSDQRAVLQSAFMDRSVQLGVGYAASADFSPDTTQLAIGTMNGTVDIINCQTGKISRTLRTGYTVVNSVAYSPDGRLLAVGNRDGRCLLLDVSRGTRNVLHKRRGTSINCVRFSHDGEQLAMLVDDGREQSIIVSYLRSGRAESSGVQDRVKGLLASAPHYDMPWLVAFENGSIGRWSPIEEELTIFSKRIPAELLDRLSFAPVYEDQLWSWSRESVIAE